MMFEGSECKCERANGKERVPMVAKLFEFAFTSPARDVPRLSGRGSYSLSNCAGACAVNRRMK